MQISKVQAVIGLALGCLAALGYATDALNYYQPRAMADREFASIRSWSELESIKHQIEVLELKIARIIDLAAMQNRGLTLQESHEVESLREEIRLHNDRKNQILVRQQ